MRSGAASREPTECEGSTHTGMRVRRLITGTCAKSTMLRCGAPLSPFMPRRQKITREFPSEARYSAAFSDSFRLMPKPRLSIAG